MPVVRRVAECEVSGLVDVVIVEDDDIPVRVVFLVILVVVIRVAVINICLR